MCPRRPQPGSLDIAREPGASLRRGGNTGTPACGGAAPCWPPTRCQPHVLRIPDPPILCVFTRNSALLCAPCNPLASMKIEPVLSTTPETGASTGQPPPDPAAVPAASTTAKHRRTARLVWCASLATRYLFLGTFTGTRRTMTHARLKRQHGLQTGVSAGVQPHEIIGCASAPSHTLYPSDHPRVHSLPTPPVP